MKDPTLFGEMDEPEEPMMARRLPFQAHSETSRQAAEQAEKPAGRQRVLVLRALHDAGSEGLTDEQIQERTGLSPNSARPRRVELVQAGMVFDSAVRRETRSGTKAVVWRVR